MRFDFCPTECVNSDRYDPQRFKFCGDCKKSESRREFRNKAVAHLDHRLGDDAKYDVDKLIRAFYEISNLEDTKAAKLSVINGRILNVVMREKNRQRRLDDENRPK